MMMHYSTLALGIAMLCGCTHVPNPADPHDLMAIGDRIFHLGCPSTATVSERKVPNPHQPTVIDTIKTTSCDGIELSTYVSVLASNPTGLSIYIEVRKPNKELPRYMNVGEPLPGLIEALGKPFQQTAGSVTYRVDEVDDSVTFSVRDGQIQSVRWDWYLD